LAQWETEEQVSTVPTVNHIADAEEVNQFFFSIVKTLLAAAVITAKSGMVYKGQVSLRFSLIPLRIPVADNLLSEST